MYDNQVSLNRQPFAAIPDVGGYFPARSIEAARTTVVHVLKNATGIPLVFGESGTGKSLLLRMVEKQIAERQIAEHCRVVYLANRRLRSPKALYQHLLFALHQSYCGMEENELRLLFLDYLRQNETCVLALLIDEAQSVCRSVFEELRVLMHYHEENHANVRIVLAGDRRFEERLTHPHLAAFQQQVVARCYLENFRHDETDREITWQLKQAGFDRPESIFSVEARKAVHRLTEGLPRLVHQLCRQAMTTAAASKTAQIDESLVQTAWRRLQQLPEEHDSPAIAVPSTASIIEFGSLDDDLPNDGPNHDMQIALPEPEICNPIYQLPLFDDDIIGELNVDICDDMNDEMDVDMSDNVVDTLPFHREQVRQADASADLVPLSEALSDKSGKQTKPQQGGESCRKLLDELSMMEHLLTQEISVINNMKKIESDCLSRRVRCVSSTLVLASFPELSQR